MELFNKSGQGFDGDVQTQPIVECTVFEDNSVAMERAIKMRMRTNHINIKYIHFCDHV